MKKFMLVVLFLLANTGFAVESISYSLVSDSGSFCSATLIKPKGECKLITNAHCIENLEQSFTLKSAHGSHEYSPSGLSPEDARWNKQKENFGDEPGEFTIKATHFDRSKDLALLELPDAIKEGSCKKLDSITERNIPDPEEVFYTGFTREEVDEDIQPKLFYPDGSFERPDGSIKVQVVKQDYLLSELPGLNFVYEFSNSYYPGGTSGGRATTPEGKFVGITYARVPSQSKALIIPRAEAFDYALEPTQNDEEPVLKQDILYVGGSGTKTGGSGVKTKAGCESGGSGVKTGGSGVKTGGSGVKTGGSGVKTGGSGTNTGGSGVKTKAGCESGGSGVKTGGSGVKTGGSGVKTKAGCESGGSGVKTGGSGTKTGGSGVKTGGSGVKTNCEDDEEEPEDVGEDQVNCIPISSLKQFIGDSEGFVRDMQDVVLNINGYQVNDYSDIRLQEQTLDIVTRDIDGYPDLEIRKDIIKRLKGELSFPQADHGWFGHEPEKVRRWQRKANGELETNIKVTDDKINLELGAHFVNTGNGTLQQDNSIRGYLDVARSFNISNSDDYKEIYLTTPGTKLVCKNNNYQKLICTNDDYTESLTISVGRSSSGGPNFEYFKRSGNYLHYYFGKQ